MLTRLAGRGELSFSEYSGIDSHQFQPADTCFITVPSSRGPPKGSKRVKRGSNETEESNSRPKKQRIIVIDSKKEADASTVSDRHSASKQQTSRPQPPSEAQQTIPVSNHTLHPPTSAPLHDDSGHTTTNYQQMQFPAVPTLNTAPHTFTANSASRAPYEHDPFGQMPSSIPLLSNALGSPSFRSHVPSLPPYDPGFADSSSGAINPHHQMQNLGQPQTLSSYNGSHQSEEPRSQSAIPSLSFSHSSASNLLQNQSSQRNDTTSQAAMPSTTVTAPPYEHRQHSPIIDGQDASEGRMLLVESAAAARRGEGEAHEDDDHVTEHYRGASSGIPSLHALRHKSDDGPAHLNKRARAYSMSASLQLRPGHIDYYGSTSPEYSRNVVGYGDSLRTQADERGVFVEDERDHFTLPPIRLLSSHSGGDALGSPNFPVHVPKGLFDRLIS